MALKRGAEGVATLPWWTLRMDVDLPSCDGEQGQWRRKLAVIGDRASSLDPTAKGLLWAGVIIVWQAITVTVFSVPLALLHWKAPSAGQWFGFLLCGFLGSLGHYCLTRSFRIADISATQSVKFLDLLWAALMGWLIFGDAPSRSILIGGVVICASTIWIARRESRASASTSR